MKILRIIKVIAEAFFLYGLIIFLYIVGVSYFQPYWLDKQVTHLQEGIAWLSWLRNDTLGIIAFFVSLCGFIVMRYLCKE